MDQRRGHGMPPKRASRCWASATARGLWGRAEQQCQHTGPVGRPFATASQRSVNRAGSGLILLAIRPEKH